MFDQDLEAERDEHRAAEHFEPRSEAVSEASGSKARWEGQSERNESDARDCQKEWKLQHRQSHSDRQRVDGCGDPENQERSNAKVSRLLVIVVPAQALTNHPRPDEGQQRKRDPVIPRRDFREEFSSRDPSQRRHRALKNSEGDRQLQCCPYTAPARNSAGTCRDGHRVHRHAEGEQQKGPGLHWISRFRDFAISRWEGKNRAFAKSRNREIWSAVRIL